MLSAILRRDPGGGPIMCPLRMERTCFSADFPKNPAAVLRAVQDSNVIFRFEIETPGFTHMLCIF